MAWKTSEWGSSGQWRQTPVRSAFVYSLRNQGRTSALASLLSSEAVSPQTSLDEARSAARDLAEIGAIDQAEAALMTIERNTTFALVNIREAIEQEHKARECATPPE